MQLSEFLPDRRAGKRGTKPIDKVVLLTELFKLIKFNLGWRNINHSTTVRYYFFECQRRGLLKIFLKKLRGNINIKRFKKVIIDSSEFESWKNQLLVSYSSKSKTYSTKLSIEVTPNCEFLDYIFSKGSASDSIELDKLYANRKELPYELFMDKGYERYSRRREYKQIGCQVRMEQKTFGNNKKRGKKFTFTKEDKKIRSLIKKVFGWIKSFNAIRYNRLKTASLFHGFVGLVLGYYSFNR